MADRARFLGKLSPIRHVMFIFRGEYVDLPDGKDKPPGGVSPEMTKLFFVPSSAEDGIL